MKKVLIIAVVATFFASCGASTPYDSFRKENKEDIAFSLSASNFLVNMFVDDDDFKELNQVVSGISRYRVLVGAEVGTENLERKFNKFVSQKGYESLMFVNSDGARVGLYYFEKRNKIKEVIMKVKDDKDFVIISAEGNIKIKDIDGLMNKAIVKLN
ncbi:DUF4252 domain-containing protein [Galbibacter orientalis]|uniref:DUF4252 domain-containing protein n=1 Tax=Galbibacter orientalis DSM 19592 TaxID=926559 RepID=I3C5X7_9FLAO|nr:DUF4252 domain-containing protein [Galbibacter orientalis]EIJ39020.1 hypothetical protein JoomaDRAFT_2024 [Galbibacter orientalis DSM 19592]